MEQELETTEETEKGLMVRDEDGLNPRQRKFLDVLFDEAEGNLRRAAKLAGYNDSTKLNVILRPIRDEVVERAKDYLALTSPEAVFSIYDVMVNPKQIGGKVKLDAAKEILDRAGVVKKEEAKAPQAVQNIFVLPEKKKVEVIDGEYEVL